MAYFVITGKNDCPNCTHAIHVADFLTKRLPSFKYRAIIKPENEWTQWLDQINSVNNWYQTKSPVIWKEVSRMGGKAHLIGGLGEFWEYCYDYYGFQSRMSKEDLAKIMADNLLIASYAVELQCKNISIIGATSYLMLEMVIYEIESCFGTGDGKNIEIKLYDQCLDDADEEDYLLDVVDKLRDMIKCVPQSITVVTTLEEAIDQCDLMIIIENFSRNSGENVDLWLERCKNAMVLIAEDINVYSKRSLRVILNHPGPVCFNASVLMEYCTTIRLANIVAVTTDEGISVISMMAEKIGIMSHVTVAAAAIKTEVYRPYKRALKIKETSKLPKGVVQQEIRFLGSLLKTEDSLYAEIERRRELEVKLLERQPILPKIRALGSLLRLWFSKEVGDDIISLGICSNGSFGFAPGICFSQAVTLNEKRIWEPLSTLPLYATTVLRIQEISLQVENIIKKFGLGERLNLDASADLSYS